MRRPDDTPLDRFPCATQLDAHVIDTRGEEPRLHGYAIETDLAAHYAAHEVLYLALVGELPAAPIARAFSEALVFATSLPPGDAASHAAVLARICGARDASIASVAALGVADRADRIATLLALSKTRTAGDPLPIEQRASGAPERAAVQRLRSGAAQAIVDVGLFDADPSRELALVSVLRSCGLEQPWQIAGALTLATFPVALAEAFRAKSADIRSYPVNLPRFAYVDSSETPSQP